MNAINKPGCLHFDQFWIRFIVDLLQQEQRSVLRAPVWVRFSVSGCMGAFKELRDLGEGAYIPVAKVAAKCKEILIK